MALTDLLIVFMAGAGLGALYFAWLWASVWRLTKSGSTGLFVIGTFGRFALVLAALFGLFAMAHGSLAEVGAALCGFLAARLIALRFPHQP